MLTHLAPPRYHMRETQAAKNLLFRRLRCLANYENANKALEKARARNKEVSQAEGEQQEACQMFEKISERAREELKALKARRVASFQKSLSELAELELKHSKAHAQMLKVTIANLRSELWNQNRYPLSSSTVIHTHFMQCPFSKSFFFECEKIGALTNYV